MDNAILFKALQSKLKYRNPENLLKNIDKGLFSKADLVQAENYLKQLRQQGIQYTFPGDPVYPQAFYKMLEPPLFIEFIGAPAWLTMNFLAVVGSRDCHVLTEQWMNTQLLHFLKIEHIGVVSGGARGVDMKAHALAVRAQKPTVVVLPSGLSYVYPSELKGLISSIIDGGGAIVSEFNRNQTIHRSFFYFRNRLIAALGKMCLVTQASTKSGTLLTVHHALQNGKPVATLPSHPQMKEFSGNLQLISDGAVIIQNCVSLYDFWKAESWSS